MDALFSYIFETHGPPKALLKITITQNEPNVTAVPKMMTGKLAVILFLPRSADRSVFPRDLILNRPKVLYYI